MTTQVLVVGAGPTGLTLAVELARRGVTVRVVDASAAVHSETRALGVQPRTLELFERLGITQAAVERGQRVTEFNVLSEGHPILRMSLRQIDSPYPFLLNLPQDATEALLQERLTTEGVRVERAVTLTDLHQEPDAVHARLRHPDGTTEDTTATWVVGCDGARSTVRHHLGIPFVGSAFEENFAVADLRMDWPLPVDELYAFLNRGRFVAFFPMTNGRHRVAVATGGSASTSEVTHAELQAAVDRTAPPGSTVAEIHESGRFRINQRRVERHSEGRVFLAGDAAHIHSVVGAQGMNTGIQDAFNLGWKLAAVTHGQADRRLLDSYATERAPVARRLVRGTRRITRMTLLANPAATAARRTVAPRVLGRDTVRTTLTRALTQIDVSYRTGDGAAHDHQVLVGDRAPDVALNTRHPGRLFDVLDPARHTLLVAGVDTATVAAALGTLRTRVRIVKLGPGDTPDELADIVLNDATAVHERYHIDAPELILVRPDGYLALRTPPGRTDQLTHHLRGQP